MRGHGRSWRARDRFTFDRAADDMAVLLRELDTGPVIRFDDVELAVRQHGVGIPLVWGHGLMGSVKVEDQAGVNSLVISHPSDISE
jgi:hypothetical protein